MKERWEDYPQRSFIISSNRSDSSRYWAASMSSNFLAASCIDGWGNTLNYDIPFFQSFPILAKSERIGKFCSINTKTETMIEQSPLFTSQDLAKVFFLKSRRNSYRTD